MNVLISSIWSKMEAVDRLQMLEEVKWVNVLVESVCIPAVCRGDGRVWGRV